MKTTREEDARVTLFVLTELRFVLAQARGYISKVSRERGDGGQPLAREIHERLSEIDALRERFRRVLAEERQSRIVHIEPPIVNLRDMFEAAPEDVTVGLADSLRIGFDVMVYGNAYVVPNREGDEPTHRRVSPEGVLALTPDQAKTA